MTTESDDLNRLLDALLDQARQLGEILAAERQALAEHNLNTLNRHTDAKKETLLRLEALEVQRRQLVTALGLDPALRDDCPPDLSGRWQAVLEQLRSCQEANEVNGAIVHTHQRQTQRALDLLTGRSGSETVYQADGSTAPRSFSDEIARA